MKNKWKKIAAIFVIFVMAFSVAAAGCTQNGTDQEPDNETDQQPDNETDQEPDDEKDDEETQETYFGNQEPTELPDELGDEQKQYFKQVDFDDDGVPYAEDQYLGRDDNGVDFAEKSGGTLDSMGEELSTWDPQQSTGTASGWLQTKIYDGLVQYAPGTTNIMPDLAKAWEVSDDSMKYTFYLREGVEFHNGEEMTAEDVKWSIERLMDPAYNSPRAGFAKPYIESVEAPNDYTVVINMKEPFGPFLSLLSYSSFYVLPKDYCQERETIEGEPGNQTVDVQWTDEPVGTGPWEFEEYKTGTKATLKANEDYWAGEPYLDYVVRYFSSDPEVQVQSFNAGDLDITGIPSNHWQDFQTREDEEKLDIIKSAELSTFWINLDNTDPRFKNTKIRQAMATALNREKVVQDVFKGRYIPAKGPLPPSMKYYPEEVHNNYEFSYDPEKARELLDEAGAVDEDGDGIREYNGHEMSFELSGYTSSTWKSAAQTFQANLKEVGIEMTYEQYDFATILQMTKPGEKGDFEAVTLGWIADYPDPLNFHELWDGDMIPSPNRCGYDNEEVNGWIDELRSSTDPERRAELTKKIEEKLSAEHPHIWFFHSVAYMGKYPEVHNVEMGAMGFFQEKLVGAWIE